MSQRSFLLANSQVENKIEHLMIVNVTANKILKNAPWQSIIRFDNLL